MDALIPFHLIAFEKHTASGLEMTIEAAVRYYVSVPARRKCIEDRGEVILK